MYVVVSVVQYTVLLLSITCPLAFVLLFIRVCVCCCCVVVCSDGLADGIDRCRRGGGTDVTTLVYSWHASHHDGLVGDRPPLSMVVCRRSIKR